MKKFAIILIAAALFACKKDDEYTSIAITSDTSMDFNPGQTKQITYSSAHVVSHNTPTAPTGWTVRRDGNKYLVTAPSGGSGELSGTVKISVKGLNDVTITRSVSVAVRTATEISGSANSIIVTEADKRFKFAVDAPAAVKAERLWSTSKTAVINVSYEDGWVYFATGAGDDFEPANAVVAVMDKDDNTLWSWHIWVSKEQPKMVYVNGYEMMDRNLGASSPRDFGMYYQWGRPVPFAGPVSLYNHKGNALTYSFATDEEGSHTLAYATAHPATFIAGLEADNFGWLTLDFANSTEGKGLWDGSSGATSGFKTAYDPCPQGWRTPSRDVFAAFQHSNMAGHDPEEFNVVGAYDGGWMFEVDGSQIFFPAAGRRSFSPSLATWKRNYTNVVNDDDGDGSPVGFYWYSDPTNSFTFASDRISWTLGLGTPVEDIARAGGFSVRCVQERWR